jgi:hypothetical protein
MILLPLLLLSLFTVFFTVFFTVLFIIFFTIFSTVFSMAFSMVFSKIGLYIYIDSTSILKVSNVAFCIKGGAFLIRTSLVVL